MNPHICQESRTCTCDIQALEPDDYCPVHGAGPWPPKCGICGQFMSRPVIEEYEAQKAEDLEAASGSEYH